MQRLGRCVYVVCAAALSLVWVHVLPCAAVALNHYDYNQSRAIPHERNVVCGAYDALSISGWRGIIFSYSATLTPFRLRNLWAQHTHAHLTAGS